MVPDIHAKFHNQPFIMRRAIWRHVFGHTDSLTHTIKPPMAGVQLVGHTSTRAVYPERNDSSIMTLSILMRWVVTQTNRMIPSMTRYAATTRSRRCPRESEPLACLKFESKPRVIFPLATVAMAYWEHAEYKLLL